MLCNSPDTSPASLVRKVADVYLAQDFKDPEKSAGGAAATPGAGIMLTSQHLAGLAGLYWKPDGDEFVKTYLKDGKLRVRLISEMIML